MQPAEIANCWKSLLNFTKTCFHERAGMEFIENHHHRVICNALTDILLGDTQRLIINIPPRYGKTELAVINFIAWSLGLFPDAEFIHVSYSAKLATENAGKTRDLMSTDIYRKIFPRTILRTDSKARDYWRTTRSGTMYATGTMGAITGFGAGKNRDKFGGAIIIDDPHKSVEIQSKASREAVIEWYGSTLESRKNNQTTPVILIMQRLHIEDLSGFLINSGDNQEWKLLKMPVKHNNKVLWHAKQSPEDIARLEKYNPYIFAAQYMQNPQRVGGGLFKDRDWQYYDRIPDHCDYAIITADTAQKTAEYNDYSVFQLWVKKAKNIYLVDQIRGKWEAPELNKTALKFWHQYAATELNLRMMYVEDKISGTGLIQELKRIFPVRAVQRRKDKITRAMDAVPYISGGFVFLPRDATFLPKYLEEFSAFTPLMSHKHDDQIDCTCDAIALLLAPRATAGLF